MSHFKALLSEGKDEAVSVNQRALVEKILARYSGEFTVFRELLQNADDASASIVEIHFRTSLSTGEMQYSHPQSQLPDLKSRKITTILARNNGLVFRDEDWNRLKKIAEGNPDETKIGAFGVGFYSLFSLCDDPLVSSGSKLMGFYWKNGGDQLFVKTANDDKAVHHTTAEGAPWTSFLMELREEAPMPEPQEFARFLTTCLGFTAKIKTISMFFDSHLLCKVSKSLAPPKPIQIKPNLPSISPLKILSIKNIEETPLQLRAEVSGWLSSYAQKPKAPLASLQAVSASATSFFASKMLAAFSSKTSTPAPTPNVPMDETQKDPFAMLPVVLFLRIVSANMKVTPSSRFSAEMVRATKKALPTTTSYSLIWTSKEEFDAGREPLSGNDRDDVARMIFSGLLSDLDSHGRVFIGFPTFQTTGCASSVAARFVSTVERESIDFQAAYVADWNRELLWAGGVLARSVYEEEMSIISKDYQQSGRVVAQRKLTDDKRLELERRALHLLQFFTFTASTPSPIVGKETEISFFVSNRGSSITLMSQLGPMLAQNVRLPNPALSAFIKGIPIIPTTIASEATTMMASLRERGLVRDIALDDVLEDLAAHPLTVPEAAACFEWWMSLASNRSYDTSLLTKLRSAAMLSISDPKSSNISDVTILPLASITTFANAKVIPIDVSLPSSNLPFELSRRFQAADLKQVFGLVELTVVEWTKFILSKDMVGPQAKPETNILVAPHFAEKVLVTIARAWPTLSPTRQTELCSYLSSQPFLPTQQGPKLPGETYFSNVVLFEDLPNVVLPSGTAANRGNIEKVLSALGVRRHVELQLVFTRLLGQGNWSHIDVVRYLVSVKDALTAIEIDRLRKTPWLPKEGEAKVEIEGKSKTHRYQANQLFEPTDAFRSLGLPIADWSGHRWRAGSEEAKFLIDIGLQRIPSVDAILEIAATLTDPDRRHAAFKYFLDEYHNAGYSKSYNPEKVAFNFVPATKRGRSLMCRPSEVFSNTRASVLGFVTLQENYQSEVAKLRIARDPSPTELIVALKQDPPMTIARAKEVFAYMSSQISRFASSDIAHLKAAAIIPIYGANARTELAAPTGCFFHTDSSLPSGLKAIFRAIPDFGSEARLFLVAVGVNESPSASELAAMIIQGPDRFLDLCESAESYLSVLRNLAGNYSSLPSTLRSRLKLSTFFLATKRLEREINTKKALIDFGDEDEDEGEEGVLSYKLARPSDMAINDEPQSFRVFEPEILGCPQEDTLEAFAEALGAQRISKLVTEQYRTVGEPNQASKRATELHRLVVERSLLFLTERREHHGKSELKYDPNYVRDHLEVCQVRSIQLIRNLKTGGAIKRHTSPASACASMAVGKQTIILYFAEDIELDLYDVANALCRHLLSKQRPNDALLFFTILSTTLTNLKRRGFNVTRILDSRKAEREAADRQLREERLRLQKDAEASSLSPENLDSLQQELMSLFPDADPTYLKTLLQSSAAPQLQNAANQLISAGYPKSKSTQRPSSQAQPKSPNETASISQAVAKQTSLTRTSSPSLPPPVPAKTSTNSLKSYAPNDSGLFSALRKKIKPESRSPSIVNNGFGGIGEATGGQMPKIPTIPSFPRPPGLDSGATPTNTAAIRSNVMKAIAASRPENGSLLSGDINHPQVSDQSRVKESDSYCDAAAAIDLKFVSEISGLRFFVSREIADGMRFAGQHQEPLRRFIEQIVHPLGEVFQLDPRSLHVFHDNAGPLIAFNRQGSIYLNLRFYEAWHDYMVSEGDLNEALISNFHTIAHEIAHNLVTAHDAQHSFYFSSICETFFNRMAHLLANSGARAS